MLKHTVVYNPTANSMCECFNKVLKEGFAIAYAKNLLFSLAVKRALATYRALSQMTTDVFQVKVWLDRELWMPLNMS